MALGSQSGQQIGRNKYMYRRRKGRSGKWLVVLVVLAGGGTLFWLSLPGPRNTQASQEAVSTALPEPAPPPFSPPIGAPATSFADPSPGTPASAVPSAAESPPSRADRASELLSGGITIATNVPATPEVATPSGNGAAGLPGPATAEVTEPSGGNLPAIAVVLDAEEGTAPNDSTSRITRLEELASKDPIAARQQLTDLVESGRLTPEEASRARIELNRLGEILMFDPSVLPQDPFVDRYVVQPGDSLSRIAKTAGLKSEWMMIKRINRITNPNSIRVGQSLKVPVGTFHAIVSKSDYLLDLYLENDEGRVLVASCPVGLGEFDATPTGRFVVREQSKLINPQWRNPRTGEFFYSNDPANPIGERWIGIEGIDDTNRELLGYGIHGTIDPDSIGKMESMGCIRMHDQDVKLIYDALTERGSVIEIRP